MTNLKDAISESDVFVCNIIYLAPAIDKRLAEHELCLLSIRIDLNKTLNTDAAGLFLQNVFLLLQTKVMSTSWIITIHHIVKTI